MHVTFRPIDTWPGDLRRTRQTSPFKASYQDTLQLLDRELVHLRAKNIVIQLALTEGEIRLDGMPRADARPAHPGVILAFDSMHGPLKYSTDVYENASWARQVGWQANLRAIALGLEALRKVDRYGITKRGEQYTGWKALGGGTPMPAASMSHDDAIAFLQEHAPGIEWDYDQPDQVTRAYRAAARTLHPDVGGDPELFKRLGEARRILIEGR
jgi:hypothetical protein